MNTKHHVTSMLQQIMQLYRSGQIQPIKPCQTFDISEATEAFRSFSSNNRIGQVTISFENPNSLVKSPPPKYTLSLSPDKMYVMVGCLGSLDRSLSRWMLSRVCRRFVFLGRSGKDRKRVAELTAELRAQGAHVVVVRGDVANFEDVRRCIPAAGTPIGGVVQAAMGLDVRCPDI
jgi:hypothetical protein